MRRRDSCSNCRRISIQRHNLLNGKKAHDITKTINFGLAYGMGAQGLANRIGVDLGTAKRLMQTYFATYKAVAAYLFRSEKEGLARRYPYPSPGASAFSRMMS